MMNIFRSMLKVQRMIVTGGQALEYYTTEVFAFKAFAYNSISSRLNDIDRQIFYDRSMVSCDRYSTKVTRFIYAT